MPWNIDKIIGKFQDLIAANKPTRLFFIDAKIGYICMSKDSPSNTENYSRMRTISSGPTQSHITPL